MASHWGVEELVVAIEDLSVLRGKVSPRAMGLVMEWASLRQEELQKVWEQARNLEPLSSIEPLR